MDLPPPVIKISSRHFESEPPREVFHDPELLQNMMNDFSENTAFSVRREEEPPRSFMDDIPGNKNSCSRIFNRFLNNLFENPEGRLSNSQRAFMVLFSLFEVYRVVISSYLIVFVPQNCGGYSCTILQNIQPRDNLEVVAVFFNSFMAFCFIMLFWIEYMRENKIRQFLIIDKSSSTDKEYLIQMLSAMKTSSRNEILQLNNVYRFHSHSLLICFCVNVGISCVVIYRNYLNNTTFTVFTTNALFMINRIHKALKITSSGEYNIYSAYRVDSILYNRDRETWLNRQLEEMNTHCL